MSATGSCIFTVEQIVEAGFPLSIGELDHEHCTVEVRPEFVMPLAIVLDRICPRRPLLETA